MMVKVLVVMMVEFIMSKVFVIITIMECMLMNVNMAIEVITAEVFDISTLMVNGKFTDDTNIYYMDTCDCSRGISVVVK